MLSQKLFKHDSLLGRQDGIAMLTVLMLTIILTVIGIAAISTTTMDLRMAGGERMREASVSAGEACLSTGGYIIQQVIANSGFTVPASMIGSTANPRVVKLASDLGELPTKNPIVVEIMGYDDKNLALGADTADPNAPGNVPNAVLWIPTRAAPAFIVNMDIDRLYKQPAVGGPSCYAGGCYPDIFYRITCFPRIATPEGSALGTTLGPVSAVYLCKQQPDTCQPKL
jgi:hypothetical protein